MKKLFLGIVFICVLSIILTSCKNKNKKIEKTPQGKEIVKENKALTTKYQCPMDCEKGKTYDKEGNCPVCKMTLKKKVANNHKN